MPWCWTARGGEVSGAFELADRIYAARGRKPIVAVADGMAASAAYLAASAADEVVLTTTSYVGSIGVVMRHVDYSRALANEGINVSHIFAGEHKVDGNPYQPLPTSVREHLQADIEGLYQMFVQAVAKHRGMEEQAVRDTRAAVYRGVAGVAARLADRIGTADAVIADLSARHARSYPAGAGMSFQLEGASMGDPQTIQPAAAAPAEPSTATVAAPAAASAAAPVAPAAASQGLEQARAEGAQAERARVSAILCHANAAANPTLAQTCIAGGLTAEQAQGVLDAAPAAAAATAPAAASNQFAQAMAALGNPNVSGVEAASPDGSAQAATQAAAGWGKAFGTAP